MRTFLAITLLALAGCGSGGGGGTPTAVATPTFSPPGGTYATAQSAIITCATAGAVIHYTTDGSAPTASSPAYTAAVAVPGSMTLKAYAAAPGMTDSAVASASYVIDATATPAATPTFSPGAGSYTGAQSVTMSSATPGASLYYTTDGSAPTTASTHYTAAVSVGTSLTLKAIATATGHLASDVGSAAYVIGAGGTDFATVCAGVFNAEVSLMTSCLHANPDLVAASVGAQQAFCAARQKEIAAGLIAYDATQGAACAAAVAGLACADVRGQGGVRTPAACDAALVGTVPSGSGVANQCYASNDCASGFCTWELDGGSCPGHCQAYPGLGGACASAICAEGQACWGTNGSPVCTALSNGAGGACPCADTLWCDFTGTTPTCKAKLAAGAACSTSAFDACAVGLVCTGTTTPTCQALVGLGGACTPSSTGSTECGPGYGCDPGTSKCVSWPKISESCLAFSKCIDAYCDVPGNPTSPVCKALGADSATCNPNLGGQDCRSGSCSTSSHTCVPGPNSTCALP